MRLGLFGGTFDPIHIGHLVLAECSREACKLDEVWFMVSGRPPHKPGERTSVDHRLEMVRIATAGNPFFQVAEHEAKRPGPHYSVETIEAVRTERPRDELFFLIGADVLPELPTWKEPERIVATSRLVVVNRPGEALPSSSPFEYETVEVPAIGVASREIRDRVRGGRTIRYLVPRGVEAYIHEWKLYTVANQV